MKYTVFNGGGGVVCVSYYRYTYMKFNVLKYILSAMRFVFHYSFVVLYENSIARQTHTHTLYIICTETSKKKKKNFDIFGLLIIVFSQFVVNWILNKDTREVN